MELFFLIAVTAGLCGMVAWAFSSDDDSKDVSVAVAPRRTLQDIAPSDDCRSLGTEFNRATHEILKEIADEQARLALGNKEGDSSSWDEGDRVVWEARSKSGDLIERGDIDDLGRRH